MRPELVRDHDSGRGVRGAVGISWNAVVAFAAGVTLIVVILAIVWLAFEVRSLAAENRELKQTTKMLKVYYDQVNTAQQVEERTRQMQAEIVGRLDQIVALQKRKDGAE